MGGAGGGKKRKKKKIQKKLQNKSKHNNNNCFLWVTAVRVLFLSGSHSPPHLPRMPSNTVLISGPTVREAQILIWSYSCLFVPPMSTATRTSAFSFVGALNDLLYIPRTKSLLSWSCGFNPLPTTQEKTLYMDITRWLTPKSDWLYSLQPKMDKLYTVSKKQDRELTVAQIMNSLLLNSDLNWRK